ncbi:MAG: hypothetical protein Tsb005_07050 [Gammaproteobacteria bacterium]
MLSVLRIRTKNAIKTAVFNLGEVSLDGYKQNRIALEIQQAQAIIQGLLPSNAATNDKLHAISKPIELEKLFEDQKSESLNKTKIIIQGTQHDWIDKLSDYIIDQWLNAESQINKNWQKQFDLLVPIELDVALNNLLATQSDKPWDLASIIHHLYFSKFDSVTIVDVESLLNNPRILYLVYVGPVSQSSDSLWTGYEYLCSILQDKAVVLISNPNYLIPKIWLKSPLKFTIALPLNKQLQSRFLKEYPNHCDGISQLIKQKTNALCHFIHHPSLLEVIANIAIEEGTDKYYWLTSATQLMVDRLISKKRDITENQLKFNIAKLAFFCFEKIVSNNSYNKKNTGELLLSTDWLCEFMHNIGDQNSCLDDYATQLQLIKIIDRKYFLFINPLFYCYFAAYYIFEKFRDYLKTCSIDINDDQPSQAMFNVVATLTRAHEIQYLSIIYQFFVGLAANHGDSYYLPALWLVNELAIRGDAILNEWNKNSKDVTIDNLCQSLQRFLPFSDNFNNSLKNHSLVSWMVTRASSVISFVDYIKIVSDYLKQQNKQVASPLNLLITYWFKNNINSITEQHILAFASYMQELMLTINNLNIDITCKFQMLIALICAFKKKNSIEDHRLLLCVTITYPLTKYDRFVSKFFSADLIEFIYDGKKTLLSSLNNTNILEKSQLYLYIIAFFISLYGAKGEYVYLILSNITRIQDCLKYKKICINDSRLAASICDEFEDLLDAIVRENSIDRCIVGVMLNSRENFNVDICAVFTDLGSYILNKLEKESLNKNLLEQIVKFLKHADEIKQSFCLPASMEESAKIDKAEQLYLLNLQVYLIENFLIEKIIADKTNTYGNIKILDAQFESSLMGFVGDFPPRFISKVKEKIKQLNIVKQVNLTRSDMSFFDAKNKHNLTQGVNNVNVVNDNDKMSEDSSDDSSYNDEISHQSSCSSP